VIVLCLLRRRRRGLHKLHQSSSEKTQNGAFDEKWNAAAVKAASVWSDCDAVNRTNQFLGMHHAAVALGTFVTYYKTPVHTPLNKYLLFTREELALWPNCNN
jgi:hypothetical protein